MIEKLILDFLSSHPAIKAVPLEKEAGIPHRTLSKADSQGISPGNQWRLLLALSRYGLTIEEYTTEATEEGTLLLTKLYDEQNPPELVGLEQEDDGGFLLPPNLADVDFNPLARVQRHEFTCLIDLITFLE